MIASALEGILKQMTAMMVRVLRRKMRFCGVDMIKVVNVYNLILSVLVFLSSERFGFCVQLPFCLRFHGALAHK